MAKGLKPPKPKSSGKLSAPDTQPNKPPSSLGYPVFCLRHLQNGYDIPDCQRDSQAALARKMRTLSQMTWLEVQQAPRRGLGKENIARDSLKVAIPALLTDDVTLWALRFDGNAPMVGFKKGDVFHVIWLDHNFTVYRH